MELTDFVTSKSLAELTTFKVGGPAKYFFQPTNHDELIEAIKLAKTNDLKFLILGGGSNILISDAGFDGLVIKLAFNFFDFLTPEDSDETSASFSADFSLAEAVNLSKLAELTGLEWSAGIPGTIGGAIRGNAGAFGSEMAQSVIEAIAYDPQNDEFLKFDNAECEFSYRHSIFKTKPQLIILEATLQLKAGNKNEIEAEILKNIKYRRENHPTNFPSAGSTFKNIPLKNLSAESLAKIKPTEQILERQIIPAGFVIESLGLKGYQVGEAQISAKHANFIINSGQATAKDIIELIDFVKNKVKAELGIELEEEVVRVGF
ncbi:MAG: UDP-N-acetylmuramate dehydrogenase [Patescibacteria group bacterium]